MNIRRILALSLLSFALGGLTGILFPAAALETRYQVLSLQGTLKEVKEAEKPLPTSVPRTFNPLVAPDGSAIEPIDTSFSVIVPKLGINARVIPGVNPTNPKEYSEALKKGVAHSKFSFFPDEEGVVFLFAHSTSAEWFVKELNAVFYLLKNLETGDLIILVYKNTLYTYQMRESRIVAAGDTSYLSPIQDPRMLILQTCWPPGQTTERLLIIADLADRQSK